jgi:hypothetical protein
MWIRSERKADGVQGMGIDLRGPRVTIKRIEEYIRLAVYVCANKADNKTCFYVGECH